MGYANAVLLVLFVTGFVLFAYGTTYRSPSAVSRVDVSSVDAESVPVGSNVVLYRNLPRPIRDAFDRALASDSMASVAAASSAVDARYVKYGGRYYRVTVISPGREASAVELPLGLVGLVLSSLSTVTYLLRRRETRG